MGLKDTSGLAPGGLRNLSSIEFSAIPDSVDHRNKIDEGGGSTAADLIGSWDFAVNGATWESDANSVGGSRLSLDGSDDNLDAGDLPTPSQITVALWARFDDPSNGNKEHLWDFGFNGGGTDEGAMILTDDGFSVQDGELVVFIGDFSTPTGFVPAANTWYHLAMTYNNNGDVTFYVDGAVEHTDNINNGVINDGGRPLRIGEASFGGRNLAVDVDDHHIADEAVSQSDIEAIRGLSPRA